MTARWHIRFRRLRARDRDPEHAGYLIEADDLPAALRYAADHAPDMEAVRLEVERTDDGDPARQ